MNNVSKEILILLALTYDVCAVEKQQKQIKTVNIHVLSHDKKI